MVIPQRHLVGVLTLSAVLVGCGDQPPPVEPAIPPRSTASAQAAPVVEATPAPVADAEVRELSAGVRTAMARTLTAALAELDLQPDVSLSVLHDFFQQVEAQQAVRRQARHQPIRTVHP